MRLTPHRRRPMLKDRMTVMIYKYYTEIYAILILIIVLDFYSPGNCFARI
jgi:hypothetical protein